MSDPIVWENIPKSQADNETIEEAIAAGIDAHNADTDAHMQPNESLEQHRDNSIIDHPEKSIPNDKNTILPRRFVAIVDPTDSEEFDTIVDAVNAAINEGGGLVRIVGGTHTVSSDLTIPTGVYLVGEPDLSTIVECDSGVSAKIIFERKGNPSSVLYGAENIVFDSTNNGVFNFVDGTGSDDNELWFRYCVFLASGNCMPDANMIVNFNNCTVEMQSNFTIRTDTTFRVNECVFEPEASASDCVFATTQTGGTTIDDIIINDSRFTGVVGESNNFIEDIHLRSGSITTNNFDDARFYSCEFEDTLISDNFIHFWSGTFLYITKAGCIISGNHISGGTGDRLRISNLATDCVAIGNVILTPIEDEGDQSTLMANVGDYSTDTVAFSWYNGGGQSISPTTFTKITPTEEIYDRGSNVTNGTFKAPVDGIYSFVGNIQLAFDNMRAIATIYVDGTEYQRGQDVDAPVVRGVNVSAQMQLEKDQEVELYVWNDTGADTNTSMTTFSGVLLARTSFD